MQSSLNNESRNKTGAEIYLFFKFESNTRIATNCAFSLRIIVGQFLLSIFWLHLIQLARSSKVKRNDEKNEEQNWQDQ